MVKLRILQAMGGRAFSFSPGQIVVQLDDEEAQRWIDGGLAERVVETPPADDEPAGRKAGRSR